MAIFGRNQGKSPSLSHLLRIGAEQEKGWKVRLFIKWIKGFGGKYEPFVPEKEKLKHHSTPDRLEWHPLTEDHRYTDVSGNHIVRHATHGIRGDYAVRLDAKRDKSMSARQWKKFIKAERRKEKEVA